MSTYGDHEGVLITTRARNASEQQRVESALAASGIWVGDAIPECLGDAVLDEVLDDEIQDFDVELAGNDACSKPIAEGLLALALEGLAEGQKVEAS